MDVVGHRPAALRRRRGPEDVEPADAEVGIVHGRGTVEHRFQRAGAGRGDLDLVGTRRGAGQAVARAHDVVVVDAPGDVEVAEVVAQAVGLARTGVGHVGDLHVGATRRAGTQHLVRHHRGQVGIVPLQVDTVVPVDAARQRRCSRKQIASAGLEAERRDLGLPARGGVGFAGEPERAVIHGIEAHVRVVAVTVTRVRRRPVEDDRFGLRHRAQRVVRETPRVAQAGELRARRDVVSQGDVLRLVHGDRTHEAVVGVDRVGALLVQRPVGGASTQLEPAHTTVVGPVGVHDEAADERFRTVDVFRVHQPEHDHFAQRIERRPGTRLGEAVER